MQLPLLSLLLVAPGLIAATLVIPSDVILPILSNIDSFKDLVAFASTNKANHAVAKAILDFPTVCRSHPSMTWPLTKLLLLIQFPSKSDAEACAAHFVRYSFLYQYVEMVGGPNAIASFFSNIKVPIKNLSISFRFKTLNADNLAILLDVLSHQKVRIILTGQIVTNTIMEKLTQSLDYRISPSSPIEGLVFNFLFLEPYLSPGSLSQLFSNLHYTNLKHLSITGSLYRDALIPLASSMPRSNLVSFELKTFVSHNDLEMRNLGMALVQSLSLRSINIRFVPFATSLRAMGPGFAASNLERVEMTYCHLNESISSLFSLPPSLKMLNLTMDHILPDGIVELFNAVAQSNVKSFDVSGNSRLTSSQIENITRAIEESLLERVDLRGNGILGGNGIAIGKARDAILNIRNVNVKV